jgi:hypothetical protein
MLAILPLLVLLADEQPAVKTKLVVNWWTPNDVSAIAKSQPECGGNASGESFAARLLICPNRDPHMTVGPGHDRGCSESEARQLSIDDRAGTLEFEDVPAGTHMIRFNAGSAPPVTQVIRVYGDEETAEESVEVRWVTVYGKVTKAGKPVHAQVFEAAVTDPETGVYTATFTRLPGALPAPVKPCDGGSAYWFVPETEPAENSAFDIEIPTNRVDVDVVDGETGEPIPKVRLRYAAPREEGSDNSLFIMNGGVSDEKGRATIGPLLTTRKLKVCARHEAYDHACTDEFTIKATEEKKLRLVLSKATVFEGRVLAPGKSQVNWHDRNGLTETLMTDEEGRFKMKRPHAAGELVTVSTDAGFFAFVEPVRKEGEPYEIAVPRGRRRTFEVSLAQSSVDELGFFTIALGELIVPHHGFAEHIARRGEQAALHPGWTTKVFDVIETGPISVIYAPKAFLLTRLQNWTALPETRALPRRALGEGVRVVFE